MKVPKHVSRSHPVLTPLNDDVTPNEFEVDFTFDCDNENWFLNAEISHENSTIDALVESGQAVYALHFECRATFYRNLFTFSERKEKIKIDAADLKGRVEVMVFTLSTAEMRAYRIAGQHEDYGDRGFQVDGAEMLAVGLPMSFDAFLDYDPIEKVSSILRIEKAENEEVTTVEMDYNDLQKIIMILPVEDFEVYQQLRTDAGLEGLLVANILFPAILQSLHYMASLKESPEDFEQAKGDKIWFRSIDHKLESTGCELSGNDGNACFEAAQIILKAPLRRGLNNLNEFWGQLT